PHAPAAVTYFYREGCPNCPPVRRYVDAVKLDVELVDVDTEDGMQRAIAEQVLSTPTAIVLDRSGDQVGRAGDVRGLARLVGDANGRAT
ncbi:MAG: glutaredoxin domain-containing protein, partial [Spirochaetota bacterium]